MDTGGTAIAFVTMIGVTDAALIVAIVSLSLTDIVPTPLHCEQTDSTTVPVNPVPWHFGQFIFTVAIVF